MRTSVVRRNAGWAYPGLADGPGQSPGPAPVRPRRWNTRAVGRLLPPGRTAGRRLRGELVDQVPQLGGVAHRVVAVAVVHQQVRLFRLLRHLGDRLDQLLELLGRIQVAEALGGRARGARPRAVRSPVTADDE